MRLLIITHTFPPSKHSNAKRPYYIAKGALAAGWEVDVLTSNIGITTGAEESLQHPKLLIERLDDPVIRIMQYCQTHPSHAMVVMKCINGFLWPDYCASWIKKVLRRRGEFAKYDRILAFVFPPSVLRTGQIKGLVGANWIFDYQESVSPQFEKFPRGSFIQRLLTPKLKRLERDTLQRAGKVIFTAQSNREAYIEADLAPAALTEHVPYFYDEEAFHSSRAISSDFEIGYYGNFDLTGSRNPSTFLAALAGFLEQHPEARSRTRFVFYGAWLAEHDRLLENLALHDVCRISKSVSYQEYLNKLKESPILLLVVAKAHNLFMPSKIVDYFGARRPILAFVPDESEMHEVLVEAGMADYLCADSDVEQGIRAIERLWEAYLKNCLHVDSTRISKWSSSVQVSRYVKMLGGPGNV